MIKEFNSLKKKKSSLTKESKKKKKKFKKYLLKLKLINLMGKMSKEPSNKKSKFLKKIVCQFCLRKIVKFKESQRKTKKITKNSKRNKILTVKFLMNLTLPEIQSQNLTTNWKIMMKKSKASIKFTNHN